ncbi:hypothetical protein NKG05_25780 [Oerskovia sp. M15]
MGRTGSPEGRLDHPRPLRRRSPDPPRRPRHVARSTGDRPRGPRGGHGGSRRLPPRASGSAPGLGPADESGTVRPRPRRPARAALRGLPRRAGHRDRGIPDGSQLVAASRDEQPHLAPLRATDETVELGVPDLALDVDATMRVFAATGVPVARDVATAVTARTEGWPVGVHLAALVAREGGQETDAAAVTGTDRYVAAYLHRESFRRLPEETRRFLRRTAVLDDLSGPLCDAVVGEHTARAHLRRLESSNVFLVPLDRDRHWFRYHALFREFLLDELLATEPDLADTLRVRAADWYEANGSPHAPWSSCSAPRAGALRPARHADRPGPAPGGPDHRARPVAGRTGRRGDQEPPAAGRARRARRGVRGSGERR